MTQTWSQHDSKVIPNWSQNGFQRDPTMILKWFQHYPNMIPNLSQNDPNMIPKLSQNDPKMIPKRSQSDPKMIPKWSQNDFKMIPKFVYYSPGDRAQKVIPGGAKTNESFWKFQNDVKKSILRFPSFLSTVALVIERKKLSPEARKQTRASESLKMTPKRQVYVSHHFCLL